MSPTWTISGPLLRFAGLERCPYPVHALGFRILDNKGEAWTRRFDDFKFAYGDSREAAIRGGCAVMAAAVQSLRFTPPVVLVSAISSHDERLSPTCGLARLGDAIAVRAGWGWRPDVLSKRRHESRHSMMQGAAEVRDAVVEGAYASEKVAAGTVVVLDDFATRGATIADIGRAVRSASGNVAIVGLVLGKNERVSWAGAGVNNSHIPDSYEQLWLEGEPDGTGRN